MLVVLGADGVRGNALFAKTGPQEKACMEKEVEACIFLSFELMCIDINQAWPNYFPPPAQCLVVDSPRLIARGCSMSVPNQASLGS